MTGFNAHSKYACRLESVKGEQKRTPPLFPLHLCRGSPSEALEVVAHQGRHVAKVLAVVGKLVQACVVQFAT